jgi:hypothetical protein
VRPLLIQLMLIPTYNMIDQWTLEGTINERERENMITSIAFVTGGILEQSHMEPANGFDGIPSPRPAIVV